MNRGHLLVSDPLLACWCTTCHLPKYPDLNSGCLGLSMIELMTFMTSLLLMWKTNFLQSCGEPDKSTPGWPNPRCSAARLSKSSAAALCQKPYWGGNLAIRCHTATSRLVVNGFGELPPYVTVEVTRDDFPGKPPNFRGFSIVTFDYNRVSQIDINWWNFPGWWIRVIYRGTKMDGHSLPIKTICGWISAWTFDQGPSYGLTC